MSKMYLQLFVFVLTCLAVEVVNVVSVDPDYGDALTKSLLFFEAQRAGKLPFDQRVKWRGNSALTDGKAAGIDLSGGYYDAGDNVKFGFPMAFTVTMLSWSAVDFKEQLDARNETLNVLRAIYWGTNYLMKAHRKRNVLYGEVGDGSSDHECWQRPEDMNTSRTVYKIDEQHPGSDLAGETSAAFAAASIAFRTLNPKYSKVLLNHATQLFEFAKTHTGVYQSSIPVVGEFYKSSGYEDELLWAAAWMHRATGVKTYLDFINNASEENYGGRTRSMFSWDDKYVGAQVLVAKGILEGYISGSDDEMFRVLKSYAEEFICNCVQNAKTTEGGLLWFQEWANLQYVTSASFIVTAYAQYLAKTKSKIDCATNEELIAFAKSQVNYILGSNPKHMSYMVGFGSNYPKKVHHRGASIVSIKRDPTPVGCKDGYDKWYNKNENDPNVLIGAIVGGPDQQDEYTDARDNYKQAEPATATCAPLVGVLAKLAAAT